jgi:tetratricopeptide (TPR) repeat protein
MGRKSGRTPAEPKSRKDVTRGESALSLYSKAIRHILPLAAIIVLCFIAYSNSFQAPFLYDNNEIILKDTRVHGWTADHLQRIFAGPYWEIKLINLYRPLTTFSYLLNYAVLGSGTLPPGYHLANLLLHAVNTVVVYALGLALFEEIPWALLLGALWSVHPALTESVTNLVGRADQLAAFGVLAALLAYRQFIRSPGAYRIPWLLAAAVASAIGIFSKESGIVVLGVLVLYDLAFAPAAPLRRRLPGYIAIAAPCVAYFAARAYALAKVPYSPLTFTDNPLAGPGFWTSRLTALRVLVKYLALLAWPQHLSVDYSFNAIPLFTWHLTSAEDWKTIFSVVVIIAAAALALYSYRRSRALFFGIGFFFVTMSPTSNVFILIGTIMGERFLYLPAIGFLICAVCAFRSLLKLLSPRWPASRLAIAGISLILVMAAAARTYRRNEDWLDDRQLWTSALEAEPQSYKTNGVHASMMMPFLGADWSPAIAEMDRSMKILDTLPEDRVPWTACVDAAVFYRTVGARTRIQKPDSGPFSQLAPEFWYHKALGRLLEAERILQSTNHEYGRIYAGLGRTGLSFIPSRLYLELGRTYIALDDRPHALSAYQKGYSIESDPDLLEELANLYVENGDIHGAARLLVEALYIDDSRTQDRARLIDLYSRIDPNGCSVTQSGRNRDLNPSCPLVHADVCQAAGRIVGNYAQHGQSEEALKSRRIANEELGCSLPSP